MASKGWSTLLIDTDPQGSIGLSISKKVAEAPGLAQYLKKEAPLSEAICQTRIPDLSLLPSGKDSVNIFKDFYSELEEGSFLTSIQSELTAGLVDLIIIDTPSGLEGSTAGALRKSRHVLIPVQAEPLAIRSLPQLLERVGKLRRQGDPISVAGVVATMVDGQTYESTAISKELSQIIPQTVMFEFHQERDPIYLKASANGVPLGMLQKPLPPAAHFFERLAGSLEQRLSLKKEPNYEQAQTLVD